MSDPLMERSWQLAKALSNAPEVPLELFTPRFIDRVDVREFGALLARFHKTQGSVEDIHRIGPLRPGAWVLEWRYSSGALQLQHLMVEASPPHRIGSLIFGAPWRPDEQDDTPPARTEVRLPFNGRWHVTWGGRTLEENYHRGSSAHQYAYDFSIVRAGSCFVGEGRKNQEHYCFGEDVIAPAAGRVVVAVDGVPDNEPGTKNEDQPMGNWVLLEHPAREFSVLAHLRQGSVMVAEGDNVESLQKIGECGNSGRSSKPHLHFHMQSTADLQGGVGLPPRFVRINTAEGDHESAEPRRGEWVENL